METKQQRAVRRLMTSAFFYVAISEVVFRYSYDAEDENGPSYSENYAFSGIIKDSWDRPQIQNKNCEVNFHVNDDVKDGVLNDDGDAIIGSVIYSKDDRGNETFLISIPCTSEYFESVKEMASLSEKSSLSRAGFRIGVLGFPENWRPSEPKPGEPSFWLISVEMQWGMNVNGGHTNYRDDDLGPIRK